MVSGKINDNKGISCFLLVCSVLLWVLIAREMGEVCHEYFLLLSDISLPKYDNIL